MITEKMVNSQNELTALKEAFQRFSSTGQVLQDKYEELKREVATLRTALRQKEAEVKRNERLAMLGKTAAAIAHEIRNPLGAIKLFLSMLEEEVAANPESGKVLQHIHASIERLDSTVANILQFAKEKQLDMAPVNLPSLIFEQVAHFQATEPETLKFEADLKGPVFVRGNEEALRRALFNLIVNAAQAMKRNGKITIRTAERADGGADISVRDTGPGIPSEIEETLFEPFVTTRSAGTGLGLAIVRQIAEQHGGTVRAQSPGGAEFIVSIPYLNDRHAGGSEI